MRSFSLLLTFCALVTDPCAQSSPTLSNPEWQRTRAVWFGNSVTPSIAAEVGFGCEAVAWNDKAEKAWDDAKKGDRLQLGDSLWPTLETFTDLEFGPVKVRAGNYYVGIERTADGWALALFDDEKVRAAQLEPGAGRGPAVATIPLQKTDGAGDHFAAEWQLSDGGATLQLRCGPHTLSATAVVQGSKGAFPLAQPEPRHCSRLAFKAGKAGTLPFASIDHGQPKWNDTREATAQALPVGKRWRLGQDWPTTLESNLAMTIAGKKLAAGSWHLTLVKGKKDEWSLAFSTAEDDYKAKVDGFNPDGVTPVLEVPLRSGKPTAASDVLVVEFAIVGKETQLAITFGSTRLHAVVVTDGKARS